MSKLVSFDFDPANPPPLTAKLREELRHLSTLDDADIDLSDIPEVTDWSQAVRGLFHRPAKQSTTVRIDADVLAWLKAGGKGYQTRLNAILRAEMLRARG